MNVLITGNRGFIGKNLQALTGWNGIDFPDDLSDSRLTDRIFTINEYDAVVHLAAYAGVQGSISNAQKYYTNNVISTLNIANECKKYDIPLYFASSSSVKEALSPYARTKVTCEYIVKDYLRSGLGGAIMRFYTVFGEHNRKDMAVYKFTQAIRQRNQIEIYGDQMRDFTYVQDLCRGIKSMVENEWRGVFDLGYGRPISVKDMVYYLSKVIGKDAYIVEKPSRYFDPDITECRDTSLRELAGPSTDIITALQNTVKTI